MTPQSGTPVPDHGTGWGLLFLFVALYGVVAVLGAGTLAAFALRRFDRERPRPLRYLVVALLLGALAVAGFTVLVAAAAGRWGVVALLLLVVFLPLGGVAAGARGADRDRLESLAHAATAWSLPFLAGFGALAFVGTRGGPVSPAVAGAVAVAVVLVGTAAGDRLAAVSATGSGPTE